MKSVILGDRFAPLVKALEKHPGPVAYIQLSTTRESFRIKDYLGQRPEAQEIPVGEMFRERSESFRKKYLYLIGQLNQSNQCLEWWGMTLTDRMTNRPNLYREIGYFLLIVELSRLKTETLVVISDNVDLGNQVLEWAKKEGIQALKLVKSPWSLKRLLKDYTPIGIVLAFLNMTFGRWLPSRRYWPPPNTKDEHVVISSHSHVQSFARPGEYRDTYFGPLVDHLAKTGQKALILVGLREQPSKQLKMLKTVNSDVPVLPVESCLTFWNLLSDLFRALSWYFKSPGVKGLTTVDDVDVSCLINRALRQERHSGNLLMNLGMYHAAGKLAKTVPVRRWVYSFENLAWEKMLLLGAQSASANIRMVGYQHSSLTNSHTGMLLAEQQESVMPLPQSILTTGDVTRKWLETEANYPPEVTVKSACALRQTSFTDAKLKAREPRTTKLLVAMATNLEEYVKVLVLLEQAFSGVSGYEVSIRPHPSLALGPAMETAPVSHPDFSFDRARALSEELQWANVVLYASSTVGLEAIHLGIPVIYLDLGNVLDTDSMLGGDEFKWVVSDPSQLIETLRKIETLTEAEFLDRQRKGREYATSYLKPVTDKSLNMFLEV